MKILILLLLFLGISSCGKLDSTLRRVVRDTCAKLSTQYNSTGPEFIQYVDAFFEAQYHWTNEKSDRPAIVNFGQASTGANATCYTRVDFTKEVLVDSKSWAKMTDIHRRLLIFHELGHCVLDRKHSLAMIYSVSKGETIIGSMMYFCTGKLLNEYELYQDEFEYELFTGDTSLLEDAFDGVNLWDSLSNK